MMILTCHAIYLSSWLNDYSVRVVWNESTKGHIWIFRLINPVVVSPTIAAVGLSFYSYGFPLVGTCLEIGAVQILVVIVFSLVSVLNSGSYCLLMDHCRVLTFWIYPFSCFLQYLRKISVFGHRIFLIYAVSLTLQYPSELLANIINFF